MLQLEESDVPGEYIQWSHYSVARDIPRKLPRKMSEEPSHQLFFFLCTVKPKNYHSCEGCTSTRENLECWALVNTTAFVIRIIIKEATCLPHVEYCGCCYGYTPE